MVRPSPFGAITSGALDPTDHAVQRQRHWFAGIGATCTHPHLRQPWNELAARAFARLPLMAVALCQAATPWAGTSLQAGSVGGEHTHIHDLPDYSHMLCHGPPPAAPPP